MNNRNYNIYFSTHTVSGIIICALLYVIFFAGSFSFFKDEISAWQSGTSNVSTEQPTFPYRTMLDSLDTEYNLAGRDVFFYFYPNSPKTYVSFTPSQDTLHNQKAKERKYFTYNSITKKETSYKEAYDVGEFLYRLHFLAQLNQVPIRIGYPFGYLVAGLVAFLFLFALITGLLLHWDKLVSNFFVFRPWSKWKTVWTDIHTALGVIGFPFQFVFAFTGVILIVNTVFLTPFSKLLYQGKMDKIYEDLEYTTTIESPFQNKPLHTIPDLQTWVQRAQQQWPDAFLKRVTIKNYGDLSMRLAVEFEAPTHQRFAGTGIIIYDLSNGKIIQQRSPYDSPTYIGAIKSFIYHLHFGDYGGYFVKIINFIMGIMGCVVIVSGILIWLVARDKKNVPAHKRKFNAWLAQIFIAICLSMFPVTALTFIAVKITGNSGQSFIYPVYFYSWLAFTLYYILRRNLNRTNRETLLVGALLSLAVPIVNGVFGKVWLWQSYAIGATDIFFIDLFWLFISVITFMAYLKVVKRHHRPVEKQLLPVQQHNEISTLV